jgi:hypothetical protein
VTGLRDVATEGGTRGGDVPPSRAASPTERARPAQDSYSTSATQAGAGPSTSPLGGAPSRGPDDLERR